MLHTDGARAYKATFSGMVRDHVVHMKKPLRVNGVVRWVKPHFTKTFVHVLPDGSNHTCRGGTQVIDRFWRTLRRGLTGRGFRVGSKEFARRVRSVQWEYWHRNCDMWAETGALLSSNRARGL